MSYTPKRGQFKGRTFDSTKEYRKALKLNKQIQQQISAKYPDDYYYWTVSLSNYEKEEIGWFEKQVENAAKIHNTSVDELKQSAEFRELWQAVLDENDGEFPVWGTRGSYDGALAEFMVFTGFRDPSAEYDVGDSPGGKK